ncbi:MAG TPA: fibronectin type III domain-containing protein [Solirubrobacteraceae bacterium]|nr:fibronectin type III domain-containing protein [Solirubrobacteraceae bacterium]
MRLILVLCLLLVAAVPAVALADAPAATTGAASGVTRSAATLNGTADPNGTSTTWYFDYGTTTAYGLQSAGGDAGAANDPVAVSTALSGLSAGTTYHYRLVAVSADGTVTGADRTFRTAAGPSLPSLSSTGAREVGPTSASLRSRIDPNRGVTTYHFEYGLSSSYGSRTPERSAGSGDSPVAVAETIEGLQPYRRYHFRVVATNEAGQRVSRNRTFTTSRQPLAVSLSLAAPRASWGEGIEVFGRVTGNGVNGILVALERQDFPFAGPFSSIGAPAPVRANRDGSFRFFLPSLFSATRLRALTRTSVSAVSPAVTANVALRVGAGVRRASRRASRIRGSIVPAAPNGRAVLQRLTRSGSWVFVRGASPRAAGANRSRYGFKVRKRRAPRTYRVRVIARDGGAHVPGTSRSVVVGALKRR